MRPEIEQKMRNLCMSIVDKLTIPSGVDRNTILKQTEKIVKGIIKEEKKFGASESQIEKCLKEVDARLERYKFTQGISLAENIRKMFDKDKVFRGMYGEDIYDLFGAIYGTATDIMESSTPPIESTKEHLKLITSAVLRVVNEIPNTPDNNEERKQKIQLLINDVKNRDGIFANYVKANKNALFIDGPKKPEYVIDMFIQLFKAILYPVKAIRRNINVRGLKTEARKVVNTSLTKSPGSERT